MLDVGSDGRREKKCDPVSHTRSPSRGVGGDLLDGAGNRGCETILSFLSKGPTISSLFF